MLEEGGGIYSVTMASVGIWVLRGSTVLPPVCATTVAAASQAPLPVTFPSEGCFHPSVLLLIGLLGAAAWRHRVRVPTTHTFLVPVPTTFLLIQHCCSLCHVSNSGARSCPPTHLCSAFIPFQASLKVDLVLCCPWALDKGSARAHGLAWPMSCAVRGEEGRGLVMIRTTFSPSMVQINPLRTGCFHPISPPITPLSWSRMRLAPTKPGGSSLMPPEPGTGR